MFTKLSVLLFWDSRDQKLSFQVLIHFISLNSKMQEIQNTLIKLDIYQSKQWSHTVVA